MATASVVDVLTGIAKSINSRVGLEVAVPGTEPNLSDVSHWVPTASPLINLLMGNEDYGCPVGRIIEIYGDFSHGKSTVLQILMNAFQAAGGISNLLDSESSWNRARAEMMGHNPKRHMTIEVDTMERGFEVIHELNDRYLTTFEGKYVPIIYGWDTIAASPTEGEKKGDEFESGMMYKARRIRQELRTLAGELPKANATLVFLNQTIQSKPKKGQKGPPPKTTPGGGGIKFWSSQRIEVFRVAKYVDPATKEPTGITSVLTLQKNKLGPPFKKVDLPIHFYTGLDPYREILNYHLDHTSFVNINGAYRKVVGFEDSSGKQYPDISFYEKDAASAMEKYPDLYSWLVEMATMHWNGLIV